jgi:hypothetical protein
VPMVTINRRYFGPGNPAVFESLVEQRDPYCLISFRDQLTNGVIDHRGYHPGLKSKTISQVGSHIIFSLLSLPDQSQITINWVANLSSTRSRLHHHHGQSNSCGSIPRVAYLSFGMYVHRNNHAELVGDWQANVHAGNHQRR